MAEEAQLHPVIKTTIASIVEGPNKQPLITEDGAARISEALEWSAGADDLVSAIAELLAFAGYVHAERGMHNLAAKLVEIASPWGYVLGLMADALVDEPGGADDEEVNRIRNLAASLDRKQVMQAPMIDSKAPKGAVRGFELFRPKNVRA